MRKSLLICGLVACTVLASASDAFAQYRYGRGGVSVGVGSGYYYGGAPYYSNYGNRWSSPYSNSYPGYSYPGYSYPGYTYGSRSYYSGPNWYTYSSPPSYYTVPNVNYSDAVTRLPLNTQTSFYADPNSANVTVMVPMSDAEVWFDGAPTRQRGTERNFHTPALPSGDSTYTIRARWNDGTRNVDFQRQVQVRPGQSVTVDFRNP